MTDDAKTMLCCCCFCAMRKMCVCSRTTTTILDYIWLLLGFCVLQAFGNNWLDGFRDFMQIILLCIWSNFLFYAAGVLDDKLSSTQQKNIGISMECNPEIDGFWWTAWNSIGKTAFLFLVCVTRQCVWLKVEYEVGQLFSPHFFIICHFVNRDTVRDFKCTMPMTGKQLHNAPQSD